jgi:hypothetical protein
MNGIMDKTGKATIPNWHGAQDGISAMWIAINEYTVPDFRRIVFTTDFHVLVAAASAHLRGIIQIRMVQIEKGKGLL